MRAQDVSDQDPTVRFISEVVDGLLTHAPLHRPSSIATNRKFAKFIRQLVETEDD
jgi:hypothetical protein